MLRTLRRHLLLAGDSGVRVTSGYRRPLGFAALTLNASTAVALTLPTMPAGQTANYALIQNPHASINAIWRDDGTDPTTSVGMLLPFGATLDYCGDIAKLKFIAASGAPVLNVALYA